VRFQVGHCGLHRLGRGEHEGQLHLARAEQLSDGAHTASSMSLTMSRRVPARVPRRARPRDHCGHVHDSPFQASRDGPAERSSIAECAVALRLERGDESRERVIALAAPVVYEIKADVAVGLGYLVQGWIFPA